MTLSVGIVCQDGALLASDTLVEYTKEFRYSSHTTKIETSDNAPFAVACAGTGTAALAARLLIKEIEDNKFEFGNTLKELERVAFLAFKQEFGAIVDQLKERGRAEQVKSILLVATPQAIHRVEICSIPMAQTCLTGFQVGGDCANAATFFLSHYLKTSRSLEDVKPLAAHFIRMGAQLNPTYVGGLELVEITAKNGTRKVPQNEVHRLKERSNEIDATIEKMFFEINGSL